MWNHGSSRLIACFSLSVISFLFPKISHLDIDKGNINAAIDMGNYLLKQPIKKKGTKALRMEAEILEFLHKEKNIKKTQ